MRSVASSDSAPVQELSPQDSILFNDALLYQEQDAASRRRRHSQRDAGIEYAGSSQTFAAVFEESNSRGTGTSVQQARSKGFANLVARAINIYETNVRVIQGSDIARGTNLSLML